MPAKMNRATFRKLVLVGGLVFFVLLGAFLLTRHYIVQSAREAMRQAEQSLMGQMVGKLEDCHQNMAQIATAMAYSPTVYSCFFQDPAERVIANEDISMVFSNTFLLDPAIADIFLYDKEMERIASAGKETEELAELGFLRQWKGKMAYSGLFAMPGTKAPCYALFFPVFDLDSKNYAEQIGMCVLVARTQKLEDILSEAQSFSEGGLYLVDAKGQVLASSKGADFERMGMEGEGDGPERNAQPLAMEGWTLVFQRECLELSQETSQNTALIAAAYLLAASLVLWLLFICYRSLVRPIQKMDAFVQEVASNPGLRIEVKEKNEIGKVEQGLNQMLDKLAQKNAEIQKVKEWAYQAELAKKQLQILVYRNQIHPHFLYNTLDCIRAMAVLNGQKPIAAITMALSKMFRFAVREENVVTVEEEVSYIREYAKIIDYRFNGKIEIQVEIEEETANKPMIKMLLQPIIENAVFHGLERKVGGGRVEASVTMPGKGRLRLVVEDNGCGMSKEALARLQASLSREQGKDTSLAEGQGQGAGETGQESGNGGVGLPNIFHRLKLFYGEKMEFSIESRRNEGTKVVIEIADQVTDRGIVDVSGFSGG